MITIMRKELEYTEQLMHAVLALHSQTSPQPASERDLWPAPPSLCAEHGVERSGIPLWPVWVSYPSGVHSQPFVPPHEHEKLKSPDSV